MGHPRITYIVYTANCVMVILSLAFAMGFYTTGLKDSLNVYDRLHAESEKTEGPKPLDYSIPDRYWRKRSIDYIIMMLWQSFALLFTYPSIFLLQSDAPQLRPKWTLSALVLLGAWGLGVSLNSAIQAGHAFFHCDMPYPELENNKLCTLARSTLVTAWISTASHFATAIYVYVSQIRNDWTEQPPAWQGWSAKQHVHAHSQAATQQATNAGGGFSGFRGSQGGVESIELKSVLRPA